MNEKLLPETLAGIMEAASLSDFSLRTGSKTPQLRPNRVGRKATSLLVFVGGLRCA